MIMEKRKGGMGPSEYANNSFSYSQDKQHHELNNRTLDGRPHRLRWALVRIHVSLRLITGPNKQTDAIYAGWSKERCYEEVTWKGIIGNCCTTPYGNKKNGLHSV